MAAISALLSVASLSDGHAADPAPLQLETRIPLGHVVGRIDHMAVDLSRHRLFVAELGNNSVGIVDLQAAKVLHRITGLKEPQGVGYVSSNDTLHVANAGDGSVRLFRGADFRDAGRIELGDDADNIRVDAAGRRVFVGYGGGALAAIDAESNRKVADIALDGHPESFRLESGGSRIFVNVPDAHAIEVVDRDNGRTLTKRSTGAWGSNFPMALDEALRQVIVVFRKPAVLAAFSMADGKEVTSTSTCGDADDVFVDVQRHRVYVSCGDGFLDVFEPHEASYRRIARIPTASGARTSLFVPELDRLFLAVRAGSQQPAELWVYRPSP
ncbi:YncE family protein [Microvirga massiliensis]|uniref:YncE family protein n=1 Tax=Microvirga massiliensis TaxID=1033741 RepID=UPI00062B86BC|nr:NHL repeat containing protein [Microvirga massiliensis]